MKFNTFLIICGALVLTSTLMCSCENSPFDPRTKYLKEWTMEFEITEGYPSSKDTVFTKIASITKMDNEEYVATGRGIYIDTYPCSVDRDGNLYSTQTSASNFGGDKIGEISIKEFAFTTGTAIDGPGAVLNIRGVYEQH